jgi:hypothetical protein
MAIIEHQQYHRGMRIQLSTQSTHAIYFGFVIGSAFIRHLCPFLILIFIVNISGALLGKFQINK